MQMLFGAVGRFLRDECQNLAAVIAYYVLFSVIPTVALIIAALGFLLGHAGVRDTVVDQVFVLLPFGSEQNRRLVLEGVRALRESSGGLSLVGLVGLAWSAVGMFGTIRWALNRAWGVSRHRGMFRQKLMDLGAVVGLWLLLGLSLSVTAAVHTYKSMVTMSATAGTIWGVVEWGIGAVLSFLAFLLLYRYVPNVAHGYRDVWPGAVVGTLLFELAKHGFAYYVSEISRVESLYGAVGGVMLFMLWVYVSAAILLFGAEVASVREQRARPV